jgi:hypothetical protein
MLPRAIVELPLRQRHIAAHALPARAARVTTVFVRRRDAFVSTALQRFLERARQLV